MILGLGQRLPRRIFVWNGFRPERLFVLDREPEATMADAEYCRAQARFCDEMASLFMRPDYQDRWRAVAQKWRDLAQEAAERERSNPTSRDKAA
jgi:hypothetical protein